MTELPNNVPNIWLRSFYGFSPEEDGYIGWTKEVGRDHMLKKVQSGDLIMVYGAGSSETQKSQRLRILGFLEVDAIPIRDVDKASETGMLRKSKNGWEDKWTYGLPVRRAWRVDETILLQRIAPKTYRPEAGQAIAAWSPALEPDEVENALKIKVSETTVFGEPALPAESLKNETLVTAFRPSKAFPGGFGERTSEYVDGPTKLYLARFNGDGAALLGRDENQFKKHTLIKVGVSIDLKRREFELNQGFPPAAVGKWSMLLQSEDYADRKSAEIAEKTFKDEGEKKFESLGGEFFVGDSMEIQLLFARIPGTSRFGR